MGQRRLRWLGFRSVATALTAAEAASDLRSLLNPHPSHPLATFGPLGARCAARGSLIGKCASFRLDKVVIEFARLSKT